MKLPLRARRCLGVTVLMAVTAVPASASGLPGSSLYSWMPNGWSSNVLSGLPTGSNSDLLMAVIFPVPARFMYLSPTGMSPGYLNIGVHYSNHTAVFNIHTYYTWAPPPPNGSPPASQPPGDDPPPADGGPTDGGPPDDGPPHGNPPDDNPPDGGPPDDGDPDDPIDEGDPIWPEFPDDGGPIEQIPTTVTPEPISLLLLGSGLAGVGGAGWIRRRRRSAPR